MSQLISGECWIEHRSLDATLFFSSKLHCPSSDFTGQIFSPGPCPWLSPPGWHAQGGSLGGHRGQGHGWAAPAVWPGPGTSALWAIDSHLQWGWAAQPHLCGPWEQGGPPGTLEGWEPPHPNSQAGRAATEAVTRLLTPRVLRVPRRRPQVKARNWGRGTRVTVGETGGGQHPGATRA